MSFFDFFLQDFGGGIDDDTATADTRTAITEAETDATSTSSASDSIAASNHSGVLVEHEDVTAPPPVSARIDDLSDIASNELNSVAPTEDVSSAAGIGDAPRTASDDTTISSVSMDDLSSLASMAPNEEGSGNSSVEEAPGPVIIESVLSAEDQQGRRWNRLRLPNLRRQSEVSDPNGQTIVSSTPSEADENVDVPSSAPSLSLSPSDIDSAVDTPSSLDSFSAISSMRSEDGGEEGSDATSSAADLPKSPHSDPWPAEPTGHDRDVFNAVGSSLLLPSRDASSADRQEGQTNQNIEWWKYLSEKDWERLQSQASSVLDSMMDSDDEDKMASLPLPPPQPPADFLNTFDDLPSLSQDARRSIVDALPQEFSCPICSDIIVGAVVVGCGCPRSTCCFQCVDGGADKPSAQPSAPEIEEIDEDEDDYVVVERPSETAPSKHQSEHQDLPVKPTAAINQTQTASCSIATCPSCGKTDSLVVPCHALDVAICNAINNLCSLPSERGDSLRAFQYYYYRRIEEWRAELLRRRNVLEEEKDLLRQNMLAMLIEAEEEAIWSDKAKKKQQHRRRPSFWERRSSGQCTRERNGFGEIAFLAGAIAIATIIGVKLIRRC
mmetsp:Transcript_31083/g.90965  ORF Transcript_31083/g.90965 Transcript_31083/m.90965 type:complete len:610 (+) Transcript_31083:128-1957(+)